MFIIGKGWLKGKGHPIGSMTRLEDEHSYCKSWASGLRTGEVSDEDIYKYVKKHTHWWNRIDTHFVSDCALMAMDILFGYVKPPKKGKWFFEDYPYGDWIEEEEWEKMDKTKYINEYLRD